MIVVEGCEWNLWLQGESCWIQKKKTQHIIFMTARNLWWSFDPVIVWKLVKLCQYWVLDSSSSRMLAGRSSPHTGHPGILSLYGQLRQIAAIQLCLKCPGTRQRHHIKRTMSLLLMRNAWKRISQSSCCKGTFLHRIIELKQRFDRWVNITRQILFLVWEPDLPGENRRMLDSSVKNVKSSKEFIVGSFWCYRGSWCCRLAQYHLWLNPKSKSSCTRGGIVFHLSKTESPSSSHQVEGHL